MEVLNQNTTSILTILEVLLYDPLYVWTITPKEAFSRQFNNENLNGNEYSGEEENVSVNVTAERALLRLKEKLQGTEEGPTSIEGQVTGLITQARNPKNLCKLFCGWQPYM